MAIRFQCGACAQPIEVDAEWASKPVLCPYCRKSVTAPAESQLDLEQIPAASPAGASAGEAFSAKPARNPMAGIALLLACLLMAQLIVASRIVAAHQSVFGEVQAKFEAMSREGAGFVEAMQRAWLAYLEEQGGAVPGWVQALTLLQCSALGTWLAAVICGILGVRRRCRRAMAVVALALSGLAPVLLCCGGVGSSPAPATPACQLLVWGSGALPVVAGGFPAAGTTKADPHSEQRTSLPRALSGTRSGARQRSLGHSSVIGMVGVLTRLGAPLGRTGPPRVPGARPAAFTFKPTISRGAG